MPLIKEIPTIGQWWNFPGFSLSYMDEPSYEVDICSPDPWVALQFKTYQNAVVAHNDKTIYEGSIFKNEMHFWGRYDHMTATNPNPYEQIIITFNEELFAREQGKPTSLDITHNRFTTSTTDLFVRQIMTSFFQEVQTGFPLGSLYLDSLTRVLATYLLQTYCDERPNSETAQHVEKALLERTIAYMYDHYTDDIRIEALAQLIHVSPHYFIRLFKKTYGIPPYQYLLNLRMKKAEKLLSHGTLSITEIAGLCGFNSQSGFNTNFKKAFGASPQTYRKQRTTK
ncbi:MAG: AraC family transcriptional regulator [Cyanobacteria bacterium]|nr:AraC family transcriptional regulator [Cyanobacteriota bacterium]